MTWFNPRCLSPGAVALADALRQNCSLQHLAASFMAKVADG